MRTKIDCCNGCKPPKRNAYCHAKCSEYKKQRAELDAKNAEQNAQKKTDCDIFCQKQDGTDRANRRKRY